MGLVEDIAGWLKEQVREAGRAGIVVGMSGGVDSSVVAALAKRAVGAEALGALMPCHSDPRDEGHARMVAERFAIETVEVNLSPVYDALVAALPPGSDLARANLKPRLRMATLYFCANSRNALVAGTGNKSELVVGYFTKYGDGGVDLLPLGDLLKGEVWALARELGVPQEVIAKPPSAGLWKGQTDEGEMGITYNGLDEVIRAIEAGNTTGLRPGLVGKVLAMQRASAHKRSLPAIFRRSGQAAV